MKPRKVKKLTLNKETISNFEVYSNEMMNKIKGGYDYGGTPYTVLCGPSVTCGSGAKCGGSGPFTVYDWKTMQSVQVAHNHWVC